MSDSNDGSQSRIKACLRCHLKKRKCDRAHPRCSTCVAADAHCEVSYKVQDAGLLSEIDRLNTRVAWLENVIRSTMPEWPEISQIPADGLLPRLDHASAVSGVSATRASSPPLRFSQIPCVMSSSVSSLIAAIGSPQDATDMFNEFDTSQPLSVRFTSLSTPLRIPETNHQSPRQAVTPPIHRPPNLPTWDDTMRVLELFAKDYKVSHQVTSLAQLLEDAQLVYAENGVSEQSQSINRFRLFLIFCLAGPSNLGYGDWNEENFITYHEYMLRELPTVMINEDLTCVQVLTMLGVLAVYEHAWNFHQIVSSATRVAVTLNLHRNSKVFLAPYQATLDTISLDRLDTHRTNIFWTLYTLDRLLPHTLGYPHCLSDNEIDLELPSSSPVGTVSPSGLLRHAVLGRRLFGQIFDTLYAPSVCPLDIGPAVVANFVEQTQRWYASSPLKASFVPLSAGTIKRQFVDDAQYQQMIMALHRPSRLVPSVPSGNIIILLEAAWVFVTLFDHYTSDKKANTHWCYLYKVFNASICVLYCLEQYRFRSDLPEIAPEEMSTKITLCRTVLRRFETCPQQPMFLAVYEKLIAVVERSTVFSETEGPASPFSASNLSGNLFALEGQVVGGTPNDGGGVSVSWMSDTIAANSPASRLLREWGASETDWTRLLELGVPEVQQTMY